MLCVPLSIGCRYGSRESWYDDEEEEGYRCHIGGDGLRC